MSKDEQKKRIALYYGEGAGQEAKDEAVKLRAKKHAVTVIDASAFLDREDNIDDIRFVGDVSDELQKRIEDVYEGKAQELAETHEGEGDSEEIDIPEDWDQLSFPELQKLASAIAGKAVRSKADALEIVEAEIERREEAEKN